MKKLLALLLALTVLLCACGNDPEPSTDATEKTTAPTEATTAPTEESTEPSEESTAPSEESTAPSEESTAPSEESTAPSEESTAPSEETTEPSEETTVPSLPAMGTTETYVLAGLSYTLTGNFEEVFQDETSASYASENLSVDVAFGAMTEVGEGITDSAAFAQYFYDEFFGLVEDAFDEVDEVILDERNGVSYIFVHNEAEPQTVVVGFYVCGEVGWSIGISGFEPDLDVENMIDMATSGVIDESAIPELPGEDDDPLVPEEGEPMELTFCGLTFVLDTSFNEDFRDTYYTGYSNNAITVEVVCEALASLGGKVTNSQEYAEYFGTEWGEALGEVSYGVAGDLHYVTIDADMFDQTAVYGFYVSGDVGWMLCAVSALPELTDRLTEIATGGTIDEASIPVIEVPELPEPSETLSYKGLTLTLPGVATPTYVDESYLYFTYDGWDFDMGAGTQEELPEPVADSAALAAQQALLYDGLWDSVSVDICNGTSYVHCQDEDGFAMILSCYVSGDNWWTVSSMDYFEDVENIIELVTVATVD